MTYLLRHVVEITLYCVIGAPNGENVGNKESLELALYAIWYIACMRTHCFVFSYLFAQIIAFGPKSATPLHPVPANLAPASFRLELRLGFERTNLDESGIHPKVVIMEFGMAEWQTRRYLQPTIPGVGGFGEGGNETGGPKCRGVL